MGYITIKATCPDCGDISTSSDMVTVRFLEGSNNQVGQYRFICPKCKKIVLKDASSNILTILAANRVKVEYYDHPIEVMERPADDVPPISLDDLIDLNEWLKSLEAE